MGQLKYYEQGEAMGLCTIHKLIMAQNNTHAQPNIVYNIRSPQKTFDINR